MDGQRVQLIFVKYLAYMLKEAKCICHRIDARIEAEYKIVLFGRSNKTKTDRMQDAKKKKKMKILIIRVRK